MIGQGEGARRELDPRLEAARYQLRGVKRIFVVLSNKGGVGKSTIALMLALAFREEGESVGLLDADLSNPTLHTFFTRSLEGFREELGVVPPEVVAGIRLSSPVLFTRGESIPSIGRGPLDAVLELLAVSNWADSSVLVVDTPPGLREEHVLLLRVLEGAAPGSRRTAVAVTTPSLVAVTNTLSGVRYLASFARGFRFIIVLNKVVEETVLREALHAECVMRVPRDPLLDEGSPTVDTVLRSSAFRALLEQVRASPSCLG